jgi:hypothetical protein
MRSLWRRVCHAAFIEKVLHKRMQSRSVAEEKPGEIKRT